MAAHLLEAIRELWMKILFVLYESFASNSAIHIHYLAEELAKRGCKCLVAAPNAPTQVPGLNHQSYDAFLFEELSALQSRILDIGGLDLIHAWTPREHVRAFCLRLQEKGPIPLILHLEDNEDALFERLYPRPVERFFRRYLIGVPGTVSHPTRHREMIHEAAGFTVILEPLFRLIPSRKPALLFTPGVDRDLFHPKECQDDWVLSKLPAEAVFKFGYSGNVHRANWFDVLSIYKAASALSEEGLEARVLRTGRDLVELDPQETITGPSPAIEFGYVEYPKLPAILACADLLVQPGSSNQFEEYRLPSKLPEYLSMGKPVVLPAANIGHKLAHGDQAFVYPSVGSGEIAEAAKHVLQDKSLAHRMGRSASEFARRQFDWGSISGKVQAFYKEVLSAAAVSGS